MIEIIKLDPIFINKIWGGNNIEKYFGYNVPKGKIGECWAISAHGHGDCEIKNGLHKGMKLSEFYKQYRDVYFNSDASSQFPLLIKVLDAQDNLSIQIHPDDAYAIEVEKDLGKTECWYVLDAKKNATIIDGHHAKNQKEFLKRLENKDLTLWKYKHIKKDDFIYMPSKTIHAINRGSFIYEVQQSSDTTYRIYDYDRKDEFGQKRLLQIDRALDVINFPSKNIKQDISIFVSDDYKRKHLVKNEYFEVNHYDVYKSLSMKTNKYLLVSVLDGIGYINNQQIIKGDHFIKLGTQGVEDIVFSGKLELMISNR